MPHTRIKTALMLSAISALNVPHAIAQDDSSQVASDVEEDFEKIIVTASRRGQAIQDVPAAISAVMPDQYSGIGFQNVGDVISYIPGVEYTDGGQPGRGSISARGIPQAASTPVFGIYVDDTPVSSNTAFGNGGSVLLDGMLIDVERIEVIKGPQGTLYGATSVGGMLRYISRDPELEETRGSIGLNLDSTAHGSSGFTVNGRLSTSLVEDVLGVTVSGYKREVGGFVDFVNPATGETTEDADESEVYGYVADVLYKPTDELDVRFKYLKQKSESALPSVVNLNDLVSLDSVVGEFSSLNAPGETDFEYEVTSGTINYDFDDFSLTSVTSQTKYQGTSVNDVTASLAVFADLLSGREPGTTTSVEQGASYSSEKFVQELRLTSTNNTEIEWITGLYFTEEDTENLQYATATPAFNLLNVDLPSNYTEYAVFGDVTYYINDDFDVTAGARVSRTELELDVLTSGVLVGDSAFTSDTIEDTIDTYLLAARYRLNKGTSLYSRIASGYRPGSTNIPIIDPTTGQNIAEPVIAPDKAWSYEVGAKGNVLDGVVSYDIALWAITWDNFQTRIRANGVSTVGNTMDGLTATGFEASATYYVTSDLTINTNIGHTNSTLDEDEPGFGGVEGENIPGLPEWTASVQWNYTFDLFDAWYGELSGGVRYTDEFHSTFSQSVSQLDVVVDARTLADISLTLSDDDIRISLYVTNLFDKKALTDRSDIILGNAVDSTGTFERPRTIGASINYSF